MKNLLLSLFSTLCFSALSAQVILPIEASDSFELTTCQDFVITADPYAGATVQSLNISMSENLSFTAIINPDYFDQIWDIDSISELRFYDGFEPSANLLGIYNSTTHPEGFLINIETDSLRIELETSELSTGNGFGLNILCNENFQALPTAKFKPQLSENWFFDENENMYVVSSCLNDSIHLAVEPIYLNPELENQNVDSMIIKWALGDRTFKRGSGLVSIDHVYTDGSGYLVTVYSSDAGSAPQLSGPGSYLKFIVQNSPVPTFLVNTSLPFCLNEPSTLLGGMSGNQVTGAVAGSGAISVSEFYGSMVYLPDGNQDNYSTNIEVTGFPEGTTISMASDLDALCVNMEHSFLGDIEMMLTCPDGTSMSIFNSYNNQGNTNQLFPGGFGGGGIFLGNANDGYPDGVPGVGFDYCFANNAISGAFADIYNNPAYLIPVSQGTAIIAGEYLPEQSFSSLIGCPVNGEWTLTVRDNWYSDDGFIYHWSLGFSGNLSSLDFQIGLVAAAWEPNDWINSVNEASVIVTPQTNEPQQITFTVKDENGCHFSKDLIIQVSDTISTLNDSLICNLTYTIDWPATIGQLSFVSGPSSDVSIYNIGDGFHIGVSEGGDYTFELNYLFCSSTVQINLSFLEEDDPGCITGIKEIVFNRDFTIVPNPASNYAEVKFDIKRAQEVQILVTTLDGKVVSKQKFHCSTGDQIKRIDLEKFESGVYLVTLLGEIFKASGLLMKH